MMLKELYDKFDVNRDFSLFCYMLCNADRNGVYTFTDDKMLGNAITQSGLDRMKGMRLIDIDDNVVQIKYFRRYWELLGCYSDTTTTIDEMVDSPNGKVGVCWSELVEFWNNKMAGRGIPTLSRITDKRKGLIRGRIKEHGIDAIAMAIDISAQSDFLNGYATGQVYGFDWIFRPNNFVKVIEGNYNNRNAISKKEQKKDETRQDIQSSISYLERMGSRRKKEQ